MEDIMSIYMQIQGIDGNVTAQGLEKYIELESFDFQVKRKMNTQPGATSDREGSKPSLSEITVTKRVDKTTPLLFSEATVGATKPQAVIKFVNTGSSLQEYLVVTLSNVLVSGYELSDNVPGINEDGTTPQKAKPFETITLNFDKIEVKYTPYDEKNKAGSPIPAGYDLKTAKAT